MSPTYFKFTTAEGVNRRLTFSEPPAWSLLAFKLHVLYGISLNNIGVSYVDSDNDEITLSSDEELQDFYKISHQANQVIKFSVVDLHASQSDAGKTFQFSSLNRKPFDTDAFEFVGDWERFPSVFVAEEDRSLVGPHAFVEVLSSNNSEAHDHTHQMDTDVDDDHSTVQPPLLNKGKDRSLSFGAASITSVLGEEPSQKHPIHVYDLNSRKDDKDKGNNFDDPSAYIHVAAQSTPKVQAKNVDDNRDTEETHAPSEGVEVDDPPLPSLDDTPASATSTSLVQDLASLVHDAAQVVSSHPELAEGLRNIGHNISTGTYWTTYRESLSNTVNGLSNPPSTEERRQAEEAAVSRLTDMVGNFFRTLSQVPDGTEDAHASNTNENRSDQFHSEGLTDVPPAWWGFRGMRSHGPFGRMRGRGSHHHSPFPHEPHVLGSRPHISPMYHSHGPRGMPHNGFSRRSRPPSFPFHPAPPAPPPHTPGGPPASHRTSTTHDNPSPAPPPPEKTGPSVSSHAQGHIPPPPLNIPPPDGSPTRMPGMRSTEIQSHGPSVNNRPQGYVPPLPISDDQSRSQPPKPSAQDLRAQVEAAKRIYKAEKERYRQERDQRRREKLARKPTVQYSATTGSAPVTQAGRPREHERSSIQFQAMYPELERVSVPRRSNTHLGHGSFRPFDTKMEDLTSRAVVRITKKLSDMGFSENAYPALPEKIKAQMPSSGAIISKEKEDDIVTTMLEELLASRSPRPNVASGSGHKDVDMAEAWHLNDKL